MMKMLYIMCKIAFYIFSFAIFFFQYAIRVCLTVRHKIDILITVHKLKQAKE